MNNGKESFLWRGRGEKGWEAGTTIEKKQFLFFFCDPLALFLPSIMDSFHAF